MLPAAEADTRPSRSRRARLRTRGAPGPCSSAATVPGAAPQLSIRRPGVDDHHAQALVRVLVAQCRQQRRLARALRRGTQRTGRIGAASRCSDGTRYARPPAGQPPEHPDPRGRIPLSGSRPSRPPRSGPSAVARRGAAAPYSSRAIGSARRRAARRSCPGAGRSGSDAVAAATRAPRARRAATATDGRRPHRQRRHRATRRPLAAAHRVTSRLAIIPMSSWARMWQWNTVSPVNRTKWTRTTT